MKKPSPKMPRARGFTLIELLVVITIIAILASMLIPVLSRAKKKAQSVTCLNNLKQLGEAIIMYSTDFQDYLPFNNWDGGNDPGGAGWLYRASGNVIPDPLASGNLNSPESCWLSGELFPYTKSPQLYLCPVDIKSQSYTGPIGGLCTALRKNRLSTYVADGAGSGFGKALGSGSNQNLYQTTKISSVWNSECYFLWEPDENSLGTFNPGAAEYNDGGNNPNYQEGVGRLHSPRGGNILAIAGDSHFITTNAWSADSNTPAGQGPGPGGRTYLWWSIYSNDGH